MDENESGKLSVTFEGMTVETDVNVIVAKTSAIIGTKTTYTTLIPREKYPSLTFRRASVVDGFYSNGGLIAGVTGGQASAEVLELDKVTYITGYSARMAITGLPNPLLEMLTWKDSEDHKVGSSTGTAYTATVSDTIYGIIVYSIGTNGQSGVFVSGLQIIYN